MYFVFVCALFDTGMRPSEAVALHWGDVDTARGTITIARSRYLGSEGATKTPHSKRTIKILPAYPEDARDRFELSIEPDGRVSVA